MLSNTHPSGLSGPSTAASEPPQDLRLKTARGGLVSLLGQAITVVLRTCSMVILARLVTPEQYGVVGMVLAFIGFLGIFRDGGLSAASIQRTAVTVEEISALFWINLAVGFLLSFLCYVSAFALAAFYHEPRLKWISPVLGIVFLFQGASAQHRASLQRRLRFGTLAAIDLIALVLGSAAGVVFALAGHGLWALILMVIVPNVVSACGGWFASGWIPGRPRRTRGLGTMFHFGGVVTLNSLVVYVVYNAEKVLLGRFLGAEVLGMYNRGYQLLNLPIDTLQSVMGSVMFPALSRVQDDPPRLRRYFLASYNLFLAVVVPLTLACALFANSIVLVLLGPRWHEVADIFRLLTPTMIAFALINPFAALMQASGRAVRSLQISFLIAPVVVVGYVLGLPHGGAGVALGFSLSMIVLVTPVIAWAKHETPILTADIIGAALHPLLASIAAAAVFLADWAHFVFIDSPLVRLTACSAVFFSLYALVLLLVLNQKRFYWHLLQSALKSREPNA